jgi:DNA ligase 1
MSTTPIRRRAFIASLALGPWCASAPAAVAAPSLLLAQDAPQGLDPRGFLVSEKLDGVRAHWDGRLLRFRSGLPVAAPADFLQRLPALPLDGELWLGRGSFDALSALVRRREPDAKAWRGLRYMLFELPGAEGNFAARAQRLQAIARQARWAQLVAVEQRWVASTAALQRRLVEVVAAGGEGLMLHRADASYVSGRSAALLKLKPLQDAEGLVLAHLPGRGRLAGRMGALRLRTPLGVEFALGSGFSDAQRERPPAVGSLVTFNHRGFTPDGVPRFASFLRLRSEHF